MDSNNLVLYYDYARERLRSQEALNREYGAKAHNILALGAALMAVAAVIITTSAPVVYSNDFWITVGCLSFAFLCVVFCGVGAQWLSSWRYGPKERDVAAYSIQYDIETFTKWAADSYNQSVLCNSTTSRKKQFGIQYALMFLVLEAGALFSLSIICCWSS